MDAELGQDLLIALGKGADLVAEQVEGAEHPVLPAKRHHELRVDAGHKPEIARIRVHVVHENRLLLGHRRADDALAPP